MFITLYYCLSHFLLLFIHQGCWSWTELPESNPSRRWRRDADSAAPAVAVSDCAEKRRRALELMWSGGVQDVFVPRCTPQGYYDNPQCYGYLTACWCCDPRTGDPLPPAPTAAGGATAGLRGAPHAGIPNCSVHECARPTAGNHTVVSEEDTMSVYMTGSALTVRCQEGFEFPGGHSSMDTTCMGLNVWTPNVTSPGCHSKVQKTVVQQIVDFFNYLFGFLFGA